MQVLYVSVGCPLVGHNLKQMLKLLPMQIFEQLFDLFLSVLFFIS